MVPMEIGMPSAKMLSFQEGNNDAKLRTELDLLKKRRDDVAPWVTAY